jgi:hypothetical protein
VSYTPRLGFTPRSDAWPNAIGHAATSRRYQGRHSSQCVESFCGMALVRYTDPYMHRREFSPDHPRACPRCAAMVRSWDADHQNVGVAS